MGKTQVRQNLWEKEIHTPELPNKVSSHISSRIYKVIYIQCFHKNSDADPQISSRGNSSVLLVSINNTNLVILFFYSLAI